MIRSAYERAKTSRMASRSEIDERNRTLEGSVKALEQHLSQVMHDKIAVSLENQEEIEIKAADLYRSHNALLIQAASWKSSYKMFYNQLHELEDVHKWAKQMESDMLHVSSSLEYAANELVREHEWKQRKQGEKTAEENLVGNPVRSTSNGIELSALIQRSLEGRSKGTESACGGKKTITRGDSDVQV